MAKLCDVLVRSEGPVVHRFEDPESGLLAFVAVDDLTLGPALGGCRALRYGSVTEARLDALRLSRAMTRKAALAGLPFGGGQSVIMLPPGSYDRMELMRAFGNAVESLRGSYVAAKDSGLSLLDVEIAATRTSYVAGLPREMGGAGDPSSFTALGVMHGMRALIERTLLRTHFEGVRVAVQGAGHAGFQLAKLLAARGARVTICDLVAARAERARDELAVSVVQPSAIYDVACDVFAPCALGGVLDAGTIPRLRCRAIAGSANNPLLMADDGERLSGRGILYAPDYAINAGGLIALADEARGFDRERVEARIQCIYETIEDLCDRASFYRKRPEQIAEERVENILRTARHRVRPHPASAADPTH